MIGISGEGGRDLLDQPGRRRALGEQLERAGGDPGGVHELTQDRVQPVGVELDPPQHQVAVLRGHLLPPGREGVPEPLQRGERRADVVGGGRDDGLEHGAPALAPLALPFEQADRRGRREVQRLGAAGDRDADGRVGERRDLLGQTPRLVAEHERDGIGQVLLVQVALAVGVHREDAHPPRPERVDRRGRCRDRGRPAGGTASPPTPARSSRCTRRPRTRRTRPRRRPRRPPTGAPSPRCPGRGPRAGASRRRGARGRSSSGTSTNGATPTNPCGVTVPVRRAITSSLTWTVATPAARARSTRACEGSRVEQRRDGARRRERLAERLHPFDQERAFAFAERPLVELEGFRDLRVPDGG